MYPGAVSCTSSSTSLVPDTVRSTPMTGSAALALARLAQLDPGGRWANRPDRSLNQIFLPWRPQTTATPDERPERSGHLVTPWRARSAGYGDSGAGLCGMLFGIPS